MTLRKMEGLERSLEQKHTHTLVKQRALDRKFMVNQRRNREVESSQSKCIYKDKSRENGFVFKS